MLKSSLCNYCGAYIFWTLTIAVEAQGGNPNSNNKEVVFVLCLLIA